MKLGNVRGLVWNEVDSDIFLFLRRKQDVHHQSYSVLLTESRARILKRIRANSFLNNFKSAMPIHEHFLWLHSWARSSRRNWKAARSRSRTVVKNRKRNRWARAFSHFFVAVVHNIRNWYMPRVRRAVINPHLHFGSSRYFINHSTRAGEKGVKNARAKAPRQANSILRWWLLLEDPWRTPGMEWAFPYKVYTDKLRRTFFKIAFL